MICRHCGKLIESAISNVVSPTGYIHVTSGWSYCEDENGELGTYAQPDWSM